MRLWNIIIELQFSRFIDLNSLNTIINPFPLIAEYDSKQFKKLQ